MALILDHFYSAALTECNSLTAIVPMENNEKSSYPVLWLLPPAGCDHTAWQRHTAVEDLADELGIIIVMPDLKLSYGLDMIHGFTYFQMLTKELPEMIADYFPVSYTHLTLINLRSGHASMDSFVIVVLLVKTTSALPIRFTTSSAGVLS